MTFTAVSVLLDWASKATKQQQKEMAKRIERMPVNKQIDSYDINEIANDILLTKI